MDYANKINEIKKEWAREIMKEFGMTETVARQYIESLNGICIPCLERLTNN